MYKLEFSFKTSLLYLFLFEADLQSRSDKFNAYFIVITASFPIQSTCPLVSPSGAEAKHITIFFHGKQLYFTMVISTVKHVSVVIQHTVLLTVVGCEFVDRNNFRFRILQIKFCLIIYCFDHIVFHTPFVEGQENE